MTLLLESAVAMAPVMGPKRWYDLRKEIDAAYICKNSFISKRENLRILNNNKNNNSLLKNFASQQEHQPLHELAKFTFYCFKKIASQRYRNRPFI